MRGLALSFGLPPHQHQAQSSFQRILHNWQVTEEDRGRLIFILNNLKTTPYRSSGWGVTFATTVLSKRHKFNAKPRRGVGYETIGVFDSWSQWQLVAFQTPHSSALRIHLIEAEFLKASSISSKASSEENIAFPKYETLSSPSSTLLSFPGRARATGLKYEQRLFFVNVCLCSVRKRLPLRRNCDASHHLGHPVSHTAVLKL